MLSLIKNNEVEVISLAEIKAHLRLDNSWEDDYLQTLIQAATQNIEGFLGKSLINKTWQLLWNCTNENTSTSEIVEIPLAYPPLIEVISINKLMPQKLMSQDKRQIIKRYFIDTSKTIPRITLFCERATLNTTLEIIYRSGYGDYPKQIPAAIRQAVLLRAADLYENRTTACFEKAINETSLLRELLAGHRIIGLG